MFRPIKLRHFLAVMKEKGHSAAAVLKDSGVSEEMLASRDFLMDLNQSRTVVSNMIALTGDQGIGLEMGSRTEAVDLSLLGHLVISARTPREALKYWVDYSNTLVGIPTRLRLEDKAADDWAIVFDESIPLGYIYNFWVEEQLGMIYKLSGDLSGTRTVMKRLELSYPAPAHHQLYPRYFPGPIKFNSRHTRISFSAPRLDQPLRGTDPDVNELCARQCEMLSRQIGQRGPFVDDIRNALMRIRCDRPTIEAIARELSISPRSLRRHLQNEGYSFQQVVNEFRAAMAKEYLRSAAMNTKEVAYLLGFKDTNSFRRAFKLWTGKTVQEYHDER